MTPKWPVQNIIDIMIALLEQLLTISIGFEKRNTQKLRLIEEEKTKLAAHSYVSCIHDDNAASIIHFNLLCISFY